jgi:C4-dicarboxylate-specific signal transduction histidine kinase
MTMRGEIAVSLAHELNQPLLGRTTRRRPSD